MFSTLVVPGLGFGCSKAVNQIDKCRKTRSAEKIKLGSGNSEEKFSAIILSRYTRSKPFHCRRYAINAQQCFTRNLWQIMFGCQQLKLPRTAVHCFVLHLSLVNCSLVTFIEIQAC